MKLLALSILIVVSILLIGIAIFMTVKYAFIENKYIKTGIASIIIICMIIAFGVLSIKGTPFYYPNIAKLLVIVPIIVLFGCSILSVFIGLFKPCDRMLFGGISLFTIAMLSLGILLKDTNIPYNPNNILKYSTLTDTSNIVDIDGNFYLKTDDKLILINSIKFKDDNGELYIIDKTSGDKDFTSYNIDGTQYVLDSKNNIVNIDTAIN